MSERRYLETSGEFPYGRERETYEAEHFADGVAGDFEGDADEEAYPYQMAEGDGGVEAILEELIDIVAAAKSVPLSASAMVSRDELIGLLEAAREQLPEELRKARHVLKDRADVVSIAHREAREIVDDARVQAEHMVQRAEIVRQAEYRAVRIVEDAEAEARRLKHQAEDFIDQRLAGFEIVLDRTLQTVRAGREKLASVPKDVLERPFADGSGTSSGMPSSADGEFFFDQDMD
jgi:hypothetical protein